MQLIMDLMKGQNLCIYGQLLCVNVQMYFNNSFQFWNFKYSKDIIINFCRYINRFVRLMLIQDKVAVLPGVDVVLQGIAIETQLVFVAIQSEKDEEYRTE